MKKYLEISKGSSGWGGPLYLEKTEIKTKVLSVTGGGIHPLAKYIADILDADVVDAFKGSADNDEIIVAVIDCGGTARCGVYPKNKVKTINVLNTGKTGPLANFIVEELYVSGVEEKNIRLFEGEREKLETKEIHIEEKQFEDEKKSEKTDLEKQNFMVKIGKSIAKVISIINQSARETIENVIRTILPFMAFISLLVGIITGSGLGDIISQAVSPLAGSVFGLLLLSVICSLPFLSPVLGPGAVISQTIGTLIGINIGAGLIPPQFALPALFAINAQVGADFIPVGLSMAEAENETVEIGVPAILFSRLITGPLAVIIAYIFSAGLYS